jgi:hypothetical protein
MRWTLAGLLVAALALVATVLGVEPATAKKPSVDTGVIYYWNWANLVTMDPDGSNSTSINVEHGEPSIALHDGERWFLQLREIEGESYPDGRVRHEIFAVTASGTAVQLTNDPNLCPNRAPDWYYPQLRWSGRSGVDDGRISYLGVRWSGSAVDAAGIFALDVDPSDLESHTAAAPSLVLEFTLSYDDQTFIAGNYDWSQDGSSIAYAHSGAGWNLYRADASDGFSDPTQLTSGSAAYPRWSPDGSKIVYLASDRGIHTISPDGTGDTRIVDAPRKGQYYHLLWSPNGTNLVYSHRGIVNPNKVPIAWFNDIRRCNADGSRDTEIGSGIPVGWRSE